MLIPCKASVKSMLLVKTMKMSLDVSLTFGLGWINN